MNQGAPVKDYSVLVTNRLLVFFLKKNLKGEWVNTEGSIFSLNNYSSYPISPNGDPSLLSVVKSDFGLVKLESLRNQLLSYGNKNLEFSRVEFTPGYCVTVKYSDKFKGGHTEKKCNEYGEPWVDYYPKVSDNSAPFDNIIPVIDLDNVHPREIHLDSLRYTHAAQIREILRKSALEIIKLDSRLPSGAEITTR